MRNWLLQKFPWLSNSSVDIASPSLGKAVSTVDGMTFHENDERYREHINWWCESLAHDEPVDYPSAWLFFLQATMKRSTYIIWKKLPDAEKSVICEGRPYSYQVFCRRIKEGDLPQPTGEML